MTRLLALFLENNQKIVLLLIQKTPYFMKC